MLTKEDLPFELTAPSKIRRLLIETDTSSRRLASLLCGLEYRCSGSPIASA